MLDTMRSLEDDLDSLKADNAKLMNVTLEHEDINKLFLKSLTDRVEQKNTGHNS